MVLLGGSFVQVWRGITDLLGDDLVTRDESTGEVVLVMLEERPWSGESDQLRQVGRNS